jgi:hypothetical protein
LLEFAQKLYFDHEGRLIKSVRSRTDADRISPQMNATVWLPESSYMRCRNSRL